MLSIDETYEQQQSGNYTVISSPNYDYYVFWKETNKASKHPTEIFVGGMSLLNDMSMPILHPLIPTFFSNPSSSSIINPHQTLVLFSDHNSMDIRGQMKKWVVFSDDDYDDEEKETETISLSDFPVVKKQDDNANCVKEESIGCDQEPEEFEFYRSRSGGSSNLLQKAEDHMCVADEVFFQGQIIPMDRCYSSGTNGSIGYRSISSSQSSDSSSSSGSHRISTSSNFYTHPSPKPHLPNRNQRVITSSRRTTSMFQFGLVRTPEIDVIEYKNQRSRRPKSVKKKKEPEENNLLGSLTIRFGCRCSTDEALEPISCSASTRDLVGKESLVPRHRRPEEVVTHNRRRTVLWLNDLNVAKPH